MLFFNPSSIAIVGVSNSSRKLGTVILSNLITGGYKGKIFPVNPKYQKVWGFKCFKNLKDINDKIDLVCIAIPSIGVNKIVKQAGELGVKNVVIISSGFSEIGGEGLALEKELEEISSKYKMTILGPNSLGFISAQNKINLSFAHPEFLQGDIAIFSQSGAFFTSILDISLDRNIGFSHLVSIGNKLGINENKLLSKWLKDPTIKVIGGYLESFEKAREFIEIYRKSSIKKPLVILKPGESDSTIRAISSHTGSIAGNYKAFETYMTENNIVIAKDIDQMFNYLSSFSRLNLNRPFGNKVGIVTNAGGLGIIITDHLSKSSLKIENLESKTIIELKKNLPLNAGFNNPVDIVGDASAERYKNAIESIQKDKNIDLIIPILTPQIVTQIEETAKILIDYSKNSSKPIIPIFLGGRHVKYGNNLFNSEKIISFNDISDCVNTIDVIHRYLNFNYSKDILLQPKKNRIYNLKGYLSENETPLLESEVKILLNEFGIEIPQQILVDNVEDAIKFFSQFNNIALKASATNIIHKTELKGVVLNISTTEQLEREFISLQRRISSRTGVENPKILIQEMIDYDYELFVGSIRDGDSNVYQNNSGFGHLLTYGQGGIYTEIDNDLAFSTIETSQKKIEEKFLKTKVGMKMNGIRTGNKVNLEKFIELIFRIKRMLISYPEISSIDFNPILVSINRSVAVDVKIFVKK